MEQLPLQFKPKPMQTHVENLQRTKSALSRHVIAFFAERHVGDRFYALDLWQYVNELHRCAPDSPRRIMSELATEGVLDYAVVSRRQSLYEITKLPEAERMAA